jgi:hypothetical protein
MASAMIRCMFASFFRCILLGEYFRDQFIGTAARAKQGFR